MSQPPRILYLLDVPAYVWEQHGLRVHPIAAHNWVKRKHTPLMYSDMSMEKGVPRKITTGAWVDTFLRQRGMIPKESA